MLTEIEPELLGLVSLSRVLVLVKRSQLLGWVFGLYLPFAGPQLVWGAMLCLVGV